MFHVLSISGVHMALAGLAIFWIVRAGLALIPSLALTCPLKKWAALAAIGGATFYLFISGGGAPPTRSYIMLVAMLVGVLADRPALSMRAVAISAALILAVQPEGVMDPSFRMSFAAIIGLIALAEWQRGRIKDGMPAITGISRLVRWGGRYLTGIVLVSIVAGLATAPFAIYHFDRAPGYSLLANLMAMPVVGAVIMPAATFAVVLMPFGLDYLPLQIMGWGVRVMTDVAHFVSDLPGAVNLVPAWSLTVLLLIVAGGLWVGLWQRRWRWFGVAPIAAGLLLSVVAHPPDILIARDVSAVAVRGADGKFLFLGDPDDYTAAQWLIRDGDARPAGEALADGLCDQWGCVVEAVDGRTVALALRAGAHTDDCARANLVISAVPLEQPYLGPEIVIDRFDVWRAGAMAIWLTGDGPRVQSVAEMRGRRPWSRFNSGE